MQIMVVPYQVPVPGEQQTYCYQYFLVAGTGANGIFHTNARVLLAATPGSTSSFWMRRKTFNSVISG